VHIPGRGATAVTLRVRPARHGGLEDVQLRLHKAPCGRTLQPSPLDQGPARGALEAYVPRLITSPSS
jgi:hypothetical protein